MSSIIETSPDSRGYVSRHLRKSAIKKKRIRKRPPPRRGPNNKRACPKNKRLQLSRGSFLPSKVIDLAQARDRGFLMHPSIGKNTKNPNELVTFS